MRGPEPLRLFRVVDADAERVAPAEVLPDALRLPADQDREVLHPAIAQCLDDMSEERFPRHGKEGLRDVRGERPHPRTLHGGEHPRLHESAPFTEANTRSWI